MKGMSFESPWLHSKVELLRDDHRGVCLVTVNLPGPAPTGVDIAIIIWRSLLNCLSSVLLEYLHLRKVQFVARFRYNVHQLVPSCNLRDYLIPSGLFAASNHDTITCGRLLDGHPGLSTHQHALWAQYLAGFGVFAKARDQRFARFGPGAVELTQVQPNLLLKLHEALKVTLVPEFFPELHRQLALGEE